MIPYVSFQFHDWHVFLRIFLIIKERVTIQGFQILVKGVAWPMTACSLTQEFPCEVVRN